MTIFAFLIDDNYRWRNDAFVPLKSIATCIGFDKTFFFIITKSNGEKNRCVGIVERASIMINVAVIVCV